jgi:hypothetical protein
VFVPVAFVLVLLASCKAAPRQGVVDGTITAVSARSVTVRPLGDGARQTFVNDDHSVTVEHLRIHRDERLPVRVRWATRDGRRAAVEIADLPSASGPGR